LASPSTKAEVATVPATLSWMMGGTSGDPRAVGSTVMIVQLRPGNQRSLVER
jgi:hypothetical protein